MRSRPRHPQRSRPLVVNRKLAFTPDGHEDRIGGFQPISFQCDDAMATGAALKAKGVEFAQDPKKEHWGTSAIFKDPDGNQYVLSSR